MVHGVLHLLNLLYCNIVYFWGASHVIMPNSWTPFLAMLHTSEFGSKSSCTVHASFLWRPELCYFSTGSILAISTWETIYSMLQTANYRHSSSFSPLAMNISDLFLFQFWWLWNSWASHSIKSYLLTDLDIFGLHFVRTKNNISRITNITISLFCALNSQLVFSLYHVMLNQLNTHNY